jgi:hypothetical protein
MSDGVAPNRRRNDRLRFLEAAARYDYWIATPEENRQVGIELPAAFL